MNLALLISDSFTSGPVGARLHRKTEDICQVWVPDQFNMGFNSVKIECLAGDMIWVNAIVQSEFRDQLLNFHTFSGTVLYSAGIHYQKLSRKF